MKVEHNDGLLWSSSFRVAGMNPGESQHRRIAMRVTPSPYRVRALTNQDRAGEGSQTGLQRVPSHFGKRRAFTRFAYWAYQWDYTGSSPGSGGPRLVSVPKPLWKASTDSTLGSLSEVLTQKYHTVFPSALL